MSNTSRTNRRFAPLTFALGLVISVVGCDADTSDDLEIREGDAASVHTLIELVADGETETTQLQAHVHQCGEHLPGDVWDDDCNVCTCADNGTVWCTLMECADASNSYATPDLEEDEDEGADDEASCGDYEVGEEWAVDCNTCHCNEQGVAECTLIFCDGEDTI